MTIEELREYTDYRAYCWLDAKYEDHNKSPCCNKPLKNYGIIDCVQFYYCSCCEHEYMLNAINGKMVDLIDNSNNKFHRHLQMLNQFHKLLTDHKAG